MKWTKELITYLIDNYPSKSYGVIDDFSNLFDVTITPNQLYAKTTNLKLKVSKERKRESYAITKRRYNYPNLSLFENIKDIEVAYIMGLFWADGYINQNTLSLEMIRDDLETLLPIFNSLGEWDISTRKRKGKKEQIAIKCHDYNIRKIFEEYGYRSKSELSPTFITNNINSEITKGFLLGWFDGDGCIYTSEKQNQVYFCGTYTQDWSYLTSLLDKLDIKYSIKLKIQKSGKYSVVYIGGRENIKNFLYWLYSTKIKGLSRKYDKYLTIV
jgi:DNA-binding transcriptional regulator WhiA